MTTPFPREALAAAAYRFAQASGERIQLAEFDAILLHNLSGVDPDELALTIRESITSDDADPAYRQSAYFALAKKSDDDLLPFFRERLRAEFDAGELDACYQLMFALEDLGEDVFPVGREAPSAPGRQDVVAYLADLG